MKEQPALGDSRRETRYGRKRLYTAVQCETCKVSFFKRDSFIKEGIPNFCTKKCDVNYYHLILFPAPVGKKTCRKCGETKPLEGEFYKRRVNSDGFTSRCKSCINEDRRLDLERVQEYRKTRPSDIGRATGRRSLLKTKYGITQEQYDDMFRAQGGVCAICKEEEIRFVRGTLANLAVDHCHKTGKIRGLLCNLCNQGIARFKDSVEFLKSAISYLEHSTQGRFVQGLGRFSHKEDVTGLSPVSATKLFNPLVNVKLKD
jgi:Recombination endonuclease VII